jgi:hypothetical protein
VLVEADPSEADRLTVLFTTPVISVVNAAVVARPNDREFDTTCDSERGNVILIPANRYFTPLYERFTSRGATNQGARSSRRSLRLMNWLSNSNGHALSRLTQRVANMLYFRLILQCRMQLPCVPGRVPLRGAKAEARLPCSESEQVE